MVLEFKKYLKLLENIKFVETNLNYQHRQHDIHMDMLVDGVVVAYADYSLFENKIHIKMIEALVKGKGYGKMLMKELARLYGYENIERRQLTPDGAKMRKELDQFFEFDYQKHLESKNKHIDQSIIKKIREKHPMVADFMSDMVLFGREFAWDKWKDKIREQKAFDFNEISDICEWIKNSATNDHRSDENVPEFITQELKKLL